MRSPKPFQPTPSREGLDVTAQTQAPNPRSFFVPKEQFVLDEADVNTTWHDSHAIEMRGGVVDSAIESPLQPTDPVPAIVLHGYGGFKNAYYQYALHAARFGKPSIYYEESREDMELSHSLRLHLRAVKAIMDRYSELYGFDQFDLDGQSMGGWIAVEAAKRWPERVRSIVLNVSAGLEPHSTLSFIPRLPKFVIGELIPAAFGGYLSPEMSLGKLAICAIRYAVTNLPRTAAEGIAVSNCDIRPQVARLRAQGMPIACVVAISDQLLPAAKTTEHSSGLFDEYIVFPVPQAGHLALQCYPAQTAQLHTDLRRHWFGRPEDPAPAAA